MDRFENRRLRLLELVEQRFSGVGAQLADAIDRAPSYVSRVLSTEDRPGHKRISDDFLALLEEKLSLAPGYFDVPIRPSLPPKSNAEPIPSFQSDLVYVDKVVGAHLAAGYGEIVYDFDNVEKSHSFRSDWMQEKRLRPERCKVWRVKGDSMEPRYSSGDIVLIDMSDREPRHGKVFALVGDEGLRIKQLRRGAIGWEMHSFNPNQTQYPPEPIVSENYAIIGRVRWHAGDED